MDKKSQTNNIHVFFFEFTQSRRAKILILIFFLGAKREVVEHVQLNNVKKTVEVVSFQSPRKIESHPKDMASVFLWTLGRSISLFQAFVNG